MFPNYGGSESVLINIKILIINAIIEKNNNKSLSYNSDDVKQVLSFNHHKKSCRSVCFSSDGTSNPIFFLIFINKNYFKNSSSN